MVTPTEPGIDDLAYLRPAGTTLPAANPDLIQQRKVWLAGLLLRHGVTHPPLPTFYRKLTALPRRALRRLGRKWAAALVGAALLFSFGRAPAAHAATITVDGVRCTLADAIRAANTDSAVGRCRAGSGADVIVLRTNVSLTAPVDTYYDAPTGLPLITSKITIQGNNRTIRRFPADPDQFRLLAVGPTGDLTLNSITLSGGHAPGQTFPIIGRGGAVFLTGGSLTLNNSTLSGNTAGEGGGIYSDNGTVRINNSALNGNAAANGGAAYLQNGTLAITGSAFDSNTSTESGGGLYILSGNPTINNSTFTDNTAGLGGGGIFNNSDLTITGSTLSGNSAYWGGAVAQLPGTLSATTITGSILSGNSAELKGGGVALGEFSTLTIDNSTLSDNTAYRGGGAYSYGWLTINDSVISGNTAQDGGGGVAFEYSGTQAIINSTLSGNNAARGGGLFVNQSGAEVIGSTFSGNEAALLGGGVYITYSDVTINNSTLSGNSAAKGGGAASGGYGESMSFINSTLSGNEAALSGGGVYIHPAGESTFQRSLVSGNAAPNGREVYSASTPYNSVNADGYNLFGFSGDAGVFGFSPGPTDIVPTEPLAAILAALANNGGPTLTHALVPGSPAIDAAPSAACAAPPVNSLDQRGLPRNVDGDGLLSENECDTGAFEFHPAN